MTMPNLSFSGSSGASGDDVLKTSTSASFKFGSNKGINFGKGGMDTTQMLLIAAAVVGVLYVFSRKR